MCWWVLIIIYSQYSLFTSKFRLQEFWSIIHRKILVYIYRFLLQFCNLLVRWRFLGLFWTIFPNFILAKINIEIRCLKYHIKIPQNKKFQSIFADLCFYSDWLIIKPYFLNHFLYFPLLRNIYWKFCWYFFSSKNRKLFHFLKYPQE